MNTVFILQSVQPLRCAWKLLHAKYHDSKFVLLSSTLFQQNQAALNKDFHAVVFLSTFDLPSIIDAIKEQATSVGTHFTFATNDEYCLSLVHQLRKHYGQECASDDNLMRYRDKTLMKACLSKANSFKIPQFYRLTGDKSKDSAHILENFTFPIIGKPVSEANNRGVLIISNNILLQKWLAEDVSYDREVETYINGDMYHFNLYCDANGNLHPLVVGKYLNPCLEFSHEKPIGSLLLPNGTFAYNRGIKIGNEVIEMLGKVKSCVYHGEYFVTKDGEAVFIEIAARAPGGMLSRSTVEVLGIDLEILNLTLQFDPNPEVKIINTAQSAFWCWIPKRVGTINSLKAPEISSKHKIEWYVTAKQTISASEAENSPACGIIATNIDFKQLCSDFDKLATIKIDLEEDHNKTLEFT